MKLIEFKEYNNLDQNTLNKKKVVVSIIIVCIIIAIIVSSLFYIYNKKFRNWADIHILMKTVSQGNLSSIEIEPNENTSIYAYDKYVAILNVNKLDIYNSSAKHVTSLDINISNPIFASNGKYLVVAEKDKQKMYLISETKQLWDTEIEGTISRVSVNENGYVSVVCSGSTYKSVVVVYNQSGEQLFKNYIPNNTVVDSAISSDNRYLSFAEVNTSKSLIQSTVKTISIKDATKSSNNSIIHTYEMPINSVIINIKYQGSKNLICMCNNGINLLSEGNMNNLMNFEEEGKTYAFAGINLNNTIYQIEEFSDEINKQQSYIKLINSGTKKTNDYSIDGIAKETCSSEDIIAINLGVEVYFIDSKGWLQKKYVTEEEIRDIKVSNRIAAIIFKDKIEILIL